MTVSQQLWDSVQLFLPSLVAAIAIILFVVLVRAALGRRYGTVPGWQLRLQLITLGLSLAGLIGVVMVIPASDLRGQLLGLIGILLSAALALSSTTLIGNAMAGLMLRGIGGFRAGDFLRVGDHFGRVSEQGLFHTEIQTEDRDLTTLPNLFLVTKPVRVIRQSGTIVSATASLGYDVRRAEIREAMLEAAETLGLGEPFVQILELGDFAVTYRVAGLLSDVKQLITTRSRLKGKVLDSLHARDIEIVSPTFMNTRALERGQVFVPSGSGHDPTDEETASPETVMFDKADHAESVENLRWTFEDLGKDRASIQEQLAKAADDTEKARLERRLARVEAQRTRVGEILEHWKSNDPTA